MPTVVDAELQLAKVCLRGGDAGVGLKRELKASPSGRVVLADQVAGHIVQLVVTVGPEAQGKVIMAERLLAAEGNLEPRVATVERSRGIRPACTPRRFEVDRALHDGVAVTRTVVARIARQRPMAREATRRRLSAKATRSPHGSKKDRKHDRTYFLGVAFHRGQSILARRAVPRATVLTQFAGPLGRTVGKSGQGGGSPQIRRRRADIIWP